MTSEEPEREGAEEAVEDLEAPAGAQGDVAGGAGVEPCGTPSMVCVSPTCKATMAACRNYPITSNIINYER